MRHSFSTFLWTRALPDFIQIGWKGRKCRKNLIYTLKESMAFTAQIFMKVLFHWFCGDLVYIISVFSQTGQKMWKVQRNSFMPWISVWLSLTWFSLHSHFPNNFLWIITVCQIAWKSDRQYSCWYEVKYRWMSGYILVTHSFIFSKTACKGGIFQNWSTGKDIEV